MEDWRNNASDSMFMLASFHTAGYCFDCIESRLFTSIPVSSFIISVSESWIQNFEGESNHLNSVEIYLLNNRIDDYHADGESFLNEC